MDGADTTPTRRPATGSQTVDRALGLLRILAAAPGGGMRLADLAAEAGLETTTAHRLVTTLVRHGFADQDPASRRYMLGLEFFTLAAAASNRFDLTEVARGALRSLSDATGDTAIFCLRSGLNCVCVDVATGSFPIRTLPMDVGSHRPLGAGASGIAMIAALPDFEVAQVLKQCARRLAHAPGQDQGTILAAVAECRRLGFALAAEEPQGRIVGLAVALINRRGRPQGTLTLSGIPERFAQARVPELAALLGHEASVVQDVMWRMPEADRHRHLWSARKARPARPGGVSAAPPASREPEAT